MGGDKPVRRCGTSRFFPPVGYRWKLDSLKARPPSRGTLARNPLPPPSPPPSWNEKWLAREREACEELCEVEGEGGRREGGNDTIRFYRRQSSCRLLITPRLLPPPPSSLPPSLAARHPVLMRRSGSRSPGHPSNLICLGLLRAGGGSF